MKHKIIRLFPGLSVAVLTLTVQAADSRTIAGSPSESVRPPQSLRLSVFDCGILHNSDAARYRFQREELATLEMSVACFLIAHPKGTLVWDAGAVPDNAWTATGTPTIQHIVLPDGQQRDITVVKSLKGQLAQLGYSPSDITYLVLSHYHYDDTANANEFAGLDRVPTFDFNEGQTRASRMMIETFLKKTGARLWIQHDIIANAKLKKSPNFYD